MREKIAIIHNMMLGNSILRKIRRFRRPEANLKPDTTHYGMKYILPENLNDSELLGLLAGIPSDVYKLPENQGVVLDFQTRKCSSELIVQMLREIVWEKNIRVIAWLCQNEESRKLLRSAGLSTQEPEPEEKKSLKQVNQIPEQKNIILKEKKYPGWKIIFNSLRSGQRIETEGDVLVWGHLNAGAEIVAGGSIIVAGKLHGIVHAGGYGRKDIFVWSGCFETPQIRLANKLCYADPDSTTCWSKCALITLEDGTPVIRENKFFKNLSLS